METVEGWFGSVSGAQVSGGDSGGLVGVSEWGSG